jgi:hypothetical protein
MMRRRPALAILLIAAAFFISEWRQAPAGTILLPGTQAETDENTVKELLAVFERADQAVKNRDIEGVMALYSRQYNYHGLKQPEIRKIWANLFDNYREIESTHLFSRIVSVGPGGSVEITCSGGVRGISRTGREDGTWKIRGNLGDAQTVLPFGTAPHPLF